MSKSTSKSHLWNRRIFFIGVKLSTADFPAQSLILKVSEAKL